MKIQVKDKSTGATKVAVRVEKPIWNMSADELIKKLNLKDVILDYHYRVEQEYKKVDDIYSDSLVEYLADVLYDYAQVDDYDGYEDKAREIVDKLQDEVIEEIYDRDEDARDYADQIREAREGRY